MKITNEFLLDLQSKAGNATQGKWKVQVNAPLVVADDEQTFRVEVAHKWGKVDQAVNDMKFIAAANPKTVLALIQDIYRLEGAIKELADKCQKLDPEFEIDKWRQWWEGWRNV